MSLVQPAAWRGARAQRGRGGAPRGAAWPPLPRRRTYFTHFRDCGHPTVCRRGGRIRMRRPRRQTASACYPGRTSAARTALHRRHSNASPAWPPPATCRRQPPHPAAAASCRQHCSDSSLLPRRRRGHECHRHVPRVPPPSASPWPLPPPGGRERGSICVYEVCVWRLSLPVQETQVFRIANALIVAGHL